MSTFKRWRVRSAGIVAERLLRHRPWWERRPVVGIILLSLVRARLRQENLFDAGVLPASRPVVPPPPPACLGFRTPDGSYNDLRRPAAGMEHTRFGRNVPLDMLRPALDVLDPNPRLISDRLMARQELQPFEGGNALLAAWIQFMIRDWFNHGKTAGPAWKLPRPATSSPDDPAVIEVERTKPDPTGALVDWPPTHVDVLTHWWDGSQIYPSDPAQRAWTRHRYGFPLRDGHIRTDLIEGLQEPGDPTSQPRCVPGFWLGLGMMMSLFAAEHNAICDALKAHEGIDDPERLYETARLVNSALMAKIHTVDWTAAVLGNPTTVRGTEIEWWGFVGEKWFRRFGRRLVRREMVCGIPGSKTQDHGVPFALTEEFVAVYRMHTMLPDAIDVLDANGAIVKAQRPLSGFLGQHGLDLVDAHPDADLLLSFGRAPAGRVSLHNFPSALRRMDAANNPIEGVDLDLAATDILRCREVGVPRYNDLRRALHMKPRTCIEEITSNRALAREISEVYHGDVEAVDMLVGLYAEDLPPGCAFSDTTFRVFLLMAPRRLLSDRFFTDWYRPDVYTKTGIDWVENNRLTNVIARHHPHLAPVLAPLTNAFHPWGRP